MEGQVKPETSCTAFDEPFVGLDPTVLHRFLVGDDDQLPQPMSPEAVAELGDPIAQLVLAKGIFPKTPEELIAAIDDAVADDDPLAKDSQLSFWLGEGSQIPSAPGNETLIRGLRFLVTRGQGPDGAEILVSAAIPDGNFIEAMGWDRVRGGFNFYRTVEGGAWAFGGNSSNAVAGETQGKGPFESHTAGNFLMKEFRFPWVHWHSRQANIFDSAFPPGDARPEHEWFKAKSGADVCELQVALPAIQRWTRVRFEQAIADDGTVADPRRILEQVLSTPTVNLVSSQTASSAAAQNPTIDLPQTFFVNSQALTEVFGLAPPLGFAVPSAIYQQSLTTFDVKLRGKKRDGTEFEQPGDTHFAFVVPEPAIEDIEALRLAVTSGLVTQRFAATLAMVDFANPVFSARREALLTHVPTTATVTDGASEFSEQMADQIVAAAPGAGADSAEAEFAAMWQAGEDGWQQRHNDRVGAYFAAVTQRLSTQDGFDDYMRLAEWRRKKVRKMPIFENPLLLCETNIEPQERRMQPDGTVVDVTADA